MVQKLRQLVYNLSVCDIVNRFRISRLEASQMLEEARTTQCEQRALWLYRELN